MARALSESVIVRELATLVCRRVGRRVVRSLQGIPGGRVSEGDLQLSSAWEEICVQIQFEPSRFWRAYEDAIESIVAAEVNKLPRFECEAIWLVTPEGEDWCFEEAEEREPAPVVAADVVDHIVREYVCAEAGRWSNPKIRAYLDRSDGPDL